MICTVSLLGSCVNIKLNQAHVPQSLGLGMIPLGNHTLASDFFHIFVVMWHP